MTTLTDLEFRRSSAPLTQERLKQVLSYDPETGRFSRISASRRTDRIGKEPGYHDKKYGRHFIAVDGQEYLAHRLAHLYVTGEWPEGEIDHKNCKPSVNEWENLRPATRWQNAANMPKRSGTSSRFKGVSWDKKKKKWAASITVNYRRIHLGRFNSEEKASEVYFAAAVKYFGEFARAA